MEILAMQTMVAVCLVHCLHHSSRFVLTEVEEVRECLYEQQVLVGDDHSCEPAQVGDNLSNGEGVTLDGHGGAVYARIRLDSAVLFVFARASRPAQPHRQPLCIAASMAALVRSTRRRSTSSVLSSTSRARVSENQHAAVRRHQHGC